MSPDRRNSGRSQSAFSLLEVLLAVSILALLASLSLPRLLRPASDALVLEARTELAQLTHQVGVMVLLEGASREQVEDFLPPLLLSGRNQPLYRLSYRQADGQGDDWWILASPPANSPLTGRPALIWDALGRCWQDDDADSAPGPADRRCSES